MTFTHVPTSWGTFVAGWERGGLTVLRFPGTVAESERTTENVVSEQLTLQLQDYLAGRRRRFEIPLNLKGTPFQHKVWGTLTRVPFGQLITYGELACRVGSPKGARAVGGAVGSNPLPIIIPCHRVVTTGGGLGGFGSGLDWKRRLLAVEGAYPVVV